MGCLLWNAWWGGNNTKKHTLIYQHIQKHNCIVCMKTSCYQITKDCVIEFKNGNDALNHCSGFTCHPIHFPLFFLFGRGVNVVPFLELIGLPDSIVDILKNSQSGNALTAYALYKVSIFMVCKQARYLA